MTTPTAETRFAEFLDAVGGAVRQSGREHVFRCPCRASHRNGDANPSGNVRIGDDGRLLVTCRAGCSIEEIVGAIGWTLADLMPPSSAKRTGGKGNGGPTTYGSAREAAKALARSRRGELVEYYIYRKDGRDHGLVARVRLPDAKKAMPQARCDGGVWTAKGMDKPIPLFNLDTLPAAQPGAAIQVHEGEQKALLATSLGFVAVSCAMGAGKAKHSDLSSLRDQVVHLFADNDHVGRRHIHDLARRAYAAGASQVWTVDLPNLPDGGDIVDFYQTLKKSGSSDEQIADEIRGAVSKAVEVDREPEQADEEEDVVAASSNQADLLVDLAAEAVLFHDEHCEVYASIPVEEHRETWRIGSSHFQRWLTCMFYRAHKSAPTATALATAILQLQAMAQFDGEQQSVHMRVAQTPTALWIDLCNEKWQAIEITRNSWRVVDTPPVRFVRSSGMKALPSPTSGYDNLDPLFDLLHFERPDLRLLVSAWLVNALLAATSYPIVALAGEQGSGKSTFSRALQRLIDPHEMEGRSPPRGEEDIAVAAQHAHVLVYENLSDISQTLSDALCRVATGAGFAARKLYTDADERQLKYCRPIVINGINDLATRSDLADRVISVQLEPIPKGKRQTEAELWSTFEAMHARLFATLLDLIVKVQRIDRVDVLLERMADYSRLGAKVAIALGLAPTSFTDAYKSNRDAASVVALESSGIGPVLLRLVRQKPFDGLVSGLLHDLQQIASVHELRHPDWPKSPRALGGELRRLNPNLARIGIAVHFQGHRREGHWISIRGTTAADGHNGHDGHGETEAS